MGFALGSPSKRFALLRVAAAWTLPLVLGLCCGISLPQSVFALTEEASSVAATMEQQVAEAEQQTAAAEPQADDADAPTSPVTYDPADVAAKPIAGEFDHSPIYSSQIKAISKSSGEPLELPGEFRWQDPDCEPMDIVYFDEKGSYTKTAVFVPDNPSANKEFTVDVTIEMAAGPFDIEGGVPGRDYEYVSVMGLVVFTNTPLTISTDPDGYSVVDGVSTLTGIVVSGGADLTLNNLHIDPVMDPSQDEYALSALTLLPSVEEENEGTVADVTLTLQGDNTVSAEDGAAVNIWENVALTIRGEGSLTARSAGTHLAEDPDSAGAGIGGDSWTHWDCGTIVIEGGTIHAIGSGDCAGIGAGNDGVVENIRIEGGNIDAKAGNEDACPIGAGAGGNGVAGVTITGGCFADYGLADNSVYGVPLATGGVVVFNSSADLETFFTFPVRVVVPVESSETDYTADLIRQAVTGDYVFTDPEGDVYDEVTGEVVAGSLKWEDGGFYAEEVGEYEARVLFVPDDVSLPSAYFTVTINVAEPAFIVEGGERGVDYGLSADSLTLYTDTPITVSMNEDGYGVVDGVATKTHIGVVMIEGDGNPTITLRDVRIREEGNGRAPLDVNHLDEDAVTTIILEGENELVNVTPRAAALNNNGSYPIVIRGTGSLVAESVGDQPAIGGAPFNEEFAPAHPVIRIEGGTITARATGDGAGIGSAAGVDAPTIEIAGGYIDASSAGGGDPIGAGAPADAAARTAAGTTAADAASVTITAGYFADTSAPATDLARANTVYGITPASPAKVWENKDAATAKAYPVYVAKTEIKPAGTGNTSGSLAATGDTVAPPIAGAALLAACGAALIVGARKRI